jgi:hypothetical protein
LLKGKWILSGISASSSSTSIATSLQPVPSKSPKSVTPLLPAGRCSSVYHFPDAVPEALLTIGMVLRTASLTYGIMAERYKR